ncbi:MAG: homoserine kinase [Bacilli bacterium]
MMSDSHMLRIVVPGSTANLGPGFDSLGLAVNRYVTLEVRVHDTWVFEPIGEVLADVPRDESNFICEVAQAVAKQKNVDLPPCYVKVYSDIPLARGLGSSASAIIASIELVNQMCDLQLTDQEKLELAFPFERHVDNVGASLYGGFIVGNEVANEVYCLSLPVPEVDIIAIIPSYHLKTVAARSVLPAEVSFSYGVAAGGRSTLLLGAFLTGNYKVAGQMMMNDLYHQPFRVELVPELEKMLATAERYEHLYGVALSGAGPTVLVLAEKGKGLVLQQQLAEVFTACEVALLSVDQKGVTYTWEEMTLQS